jgi:phage regulator Rha-like protein
MNAHHTLHPRSGATPTPGKGIKVAKGNSFTLDSKPAPHALALVHTKDEPRIDSRVLAVRLKKKRHQDLFELVKRYEVQLLTLGKLLFQTGASTGSRTGQGERFALLNEDQAYFVLTLSRNTPTVVALKLQLVKAFSAARRNAHLRQAEYLPEYHALHDHVAELARGSANQQHIHANFSRLVNKVAGIEAGQRSRAPMAILATVCSVAARAMADATDHRDGYQRAKAALMALAGLLPMAQSIRSLDTTKVAA